MAIQGIQPGIRSRGGFNVEVKLEGQWFKFNNLINNSNITIGVVARKAQREFSEIYRDKVKENIRNGGINFGYPGHSPKYSKYKALHGGPGSLLVWDHNMMNAVEVVDLKHNRYGVGIPRGIKRANYFAKEKNRLTISEYANVLEHGRPSVGLPSRPVFSDTFTKDLGGIKGLKLFIESSLLLGFRAQGIPITKL